MKRNILFISLILFSFMSFAQNDEKQEFPFWVNITAKGGFVNSHMFNNNIDEDVDVLFGYFNPGYTAGGQIGANWGGGFGGAVEVMYTRLSQSYTITNNNIEYDKDVDIRVLDKYLLFRSVGEKGSYIEIGPKFSRVMRVSETNEIITPYKGTISNYSSKERIGMLLGFGINLFFTEIYSMNLGMRVAYTLSDFMDGEHYIIEDGLHNYESGVKVDYLSYATTNPVTIEFTLSLNFHIGELELD